MTHPTDTPEHTLSLSDLEVADDTVVEAAEPNAHLRRDDSLLFQPAAMAADARDERDAMGAPATPGSGVLALPELAPADAAGLGVLLLPAPSRPAPSPARGLIAAVVIASLAMVSAVALAAHSARAGSTSVAAPPAAPEPPRTIIAPLDPPATLSMPRFEAPAITAEPPTAAPEDPQPVVTAPPTRTTPRVATVKSAPKQPAPKQPPARACGDEIECLLADSSDTPFELPREPEPDPRRPESLDSFTISRAMNGASQRVARCHDVAANGLVKLRVSVAGDGTVTDVKVTATPSQPLAACVAEVVRATEFPESRTGATFNYVFPFK